MTLDEKIELVYGLMTGGIDLEKYPEKQSDYIINEMQDDRLCGMLYNQVPERIHDLSIRLGSTPDDKDIDIILKNMMQITKYLCKKMYIYGIKENELQVGNVE